jgi:opacity protein-like surface antigen
MKKYFVPVVAISALMGSAVSANAVDLRQYVSFKVSDIVSGDLDIDDNVDTYNLRTKEFFGASVAYGVKLADFRVELEGNKYSKADVKRWGNTWIQNTSLFVNGYYDIQTNSLFTPYLGLGLGYNRIELNHNHKSDVNASMGLKAGFGVAWEINQNFALDIGYRYNYFGTYSEDDVDASLYGSEIMLGARIQF